MSLTKKKKANGYSTGIASEYFILSQLCRLEYEAYITTGNKKSIDIRVVHNDRTISLDVKAVQGYSSLIVNNVCASATHHLAFVVYNNKFNDLNTMPEVFILPSTAINEIQKCFKGQKRVFKGDILKYKDNWGILFPDNL